MLEFIFVLPILALMLLATIEFSLYTWARNRALDAATAIADLATQTLAVDDASIETFFVAADAMIAEMPLTDRSVTDFEVRLTSALACRCAVGADAMCFRSLWSHERTRGGVLRIGYAAGTQLPDIPEALAIAPGDTVVIAEYDYSYQPVVQFVLEDATLEVDDVVYYRPRASLRVEHLGSQQLTPTITCDADGVFDLPSGL